MARDIILVLLLCLLSVLSQKVNYVVILVDDLGYNDTNIGKEPFTRSNVNTPHLKQMATEGILFDNFYTGSSICTPSRGALLSGKFPATFNFFGPNRVYLSPGQTTGIPDSITTLASFLKNCDYTTGMTGKWHLGHSQSLRDDNHWMPLQKGFDSAELVSLMGNGPICTPGSVAPCQRISSTGGNLDYYPFCVTGMSDYPCPLAPFIPWNCTYGTQVPCGGSAGPNPNRNSGSCTLYRGNTIVQQPWEIANITQRLTDEALKFFDARSKDKAPFFYFFSHIAVHEPWFAGASFFGKSSMGPYGDMVEEMDWSVGQVLDRLRKSDIGPTVVYFLSDNGGFLEKNVGVANPSFRTSNGQLRGGKGQNYEGGVRTPAIVWGNAQFSTVQPNFQRNVVTHAVGHTVDIYKTIASQQNTCPAPTQILDGIDLTPVLNGGAQLSDWQTASNKFLPLFCENNVVAVRWRDAGNGVIPARDLKILFALPTWTLPSFQACPTPNSYSPGACSCVTLQKLVAPSATAAPSTWYQLFDINTNIGEDPAQNLLLNSNPQIAQYYQSKLPLVGGFIKQLMSSFDSNPASASGLLDIRTTSPSDITSLLPCPGDPLTCTINSEKGATRVVVTSSPNPSYFGQIVTFTAKVTSIENPSHKIKHGNVFFRIGSPFYQTALGPLSSLTCEGATLKTSALPVNSYLPVFAEYEGQPPIFLAATSAERIQTVLPATTTITLSTSPSSPQAGQVTQITAIISFQMGSAPLTGTISFTQNGNDIQSLTVSSTGSYTTTITFPTTGKVTLGATFTSSSTNVASSTALLDITVQDKAFVAKNEANLLLVKNKLRKGSTLQK